MNKKNVSFKLEKLRFYQINENYLNLLTSIDSNVKKKGKRPYFGILIETTNNQKYLIPLTSKPLTQNGKHRNTETTIEIYDSDKLIAALLVGSMIPVKDDILVNININKFKYKSFFNQELRLLRKDDIVNKIKIKANNCYNKYANKSISGKNNFVRRFCCNYTSLEKACCLYNPQLSPDDLQYISESIKENKSVDEIKQYLKHNKKEIPSILQRESLDSKIAQAREKMHKAQQSTTTFKTKEKAR